MLGVGEGHGAVHTGPLYHHLHRPYLVLPSTQRTVGGGLLAVMAGKLRGVGSRNRMLRYGLCRLRCDNSRHVGVSAGRSNSAEVAFALHAAEAEGAISLARTQ